MNSENLLYSKIVQIIKLWLLLCTITIILFFVVSFVYVMYLFVCADFIIDLCIVKSEGSQELRCHGGGGGGGAGGGGVGGRGGAAAAVAAAPV